MTVNFKDVLEAFEFVSFGSMYEHQAFLDKETGKVYWHSEISDDMDELPEDIDEEVKDELEQKKGERLFDFLKNLPGSKKAVSVLSNFGMNI